MVNINVIQFILSLYLTFCGLKNNYKEKFEEKNIISKIKEKSLGLKYYLNFVTHNML